MNKLFYPKLAVVNIKKNRKTYIPYLLTCIGTVMMFFVIRSLAFNSGLYELYGGGTVAMTLELGSQITAIFAVIFLFYTNSFLIKGRKKEFGLYNILGMEKRHLSRILFYETLFTAAISLTAGILLGVALNKLVFLGLLALLDSEIPLGFEFSGSVLLSTLKLFGVIFLLIFANSFRQIHLAKPIELLRGGQTGEREPKARWFMAILGVLCLGCGYYIAVTTTNPVSAISLFFVAVILVIVGTYLIFTAGSIALLKLLRKNKRYYYKTNHFISVSGMIYRMRQNAVGLANICILSTMVLVMVSSTLSLYLGMEDMLQNRYPRNLMTTVWNPEEPVQEIKEKTNVILAENDLVSSRVIDCTYLSFSGLEQGDYFETDRSMVPNNLELFEKLKILVFLPWEDYRRMEESAGTEAVKILPQPEAGEAILYTARGTYSYDMVKIFDGTEFRITERLTELAAGDMEPVEPVMGVYYLVVRDESVLTEMYERQKEVYGKAASDIVYRYGVELSGTPEQQIAAYEEMRDTLSENKERFGESVQFMCREKERSSYLQTFGGFFFIGIFLGLLFIMATILIIYYKQISEGYDDKKRFEIMQKVGLDRHEVKRSIHSQVLTVFFLPLVTAGIHVAFAFPIIRRILFMFNLVNVRLFAVCTGGVFLVFALCYALLYGMTTKVYYRIVSWENE